jgi:hypothetical protein
MAVEKHAGQIHHMAEGVMKLLTVYRYNSPDPYRLAGKDGQDGDVFDSVGVLTDGAEVLWQSDHVNTDATHGYKGGRLACGAYFGIVGYRANGKRVIKLFQHPAHEPITQIKTADQLTVQDMTLPSEIPNPNHGYQYVIQYVQVHSSGSKGGPEPTWDWSHGCITVYNHDGEYDELMKCLVDNEIIMVELKNPTDKPQP